MMTEEGKSGRLADLVNELVGAQTTARILNETWEALSPKLKGELAEAFGRRALDALKADDWHIRSFLGALLSDLVAAWFRENDTVVRAAVYKLIEEQWRDRAKEVARHACEEGLRKAGESFKVAVSKT